MFGRTYVEASLCKCLKSSNVEWMRTEENEILFAKHCDSSVIIEWKINNEFLQAIGWNCQHVTNWSFTFCLQTEFSNILKF